MASVQIYTQFMCGYCSAAVSLLKRKGADFTEIDVTGKPALRAEMAARAGGRNSTPQVFVGDVHVGGCDELYELDRAGKLDPLLEKAA
jgi:glutaredoxin 3